MRRRDLEFEVSDKVFLKVAPMKGVLRFGRKGKLSPRFIGPLEILERVGPVAYHLTLPPSLSAVHNVFHVSMLNKYVVDPSHVVDYEPLQLNENLSYEKNPNSNSPKGSEGFAQSRDSASESPLAESSIRGSNVGVRG